MKYFILAMLLPLSANAAGKIINADIAPSGTANIALNKLAASTAHNVCTFDNSGFIAGGVAPGANGNVLLSNGTDWTSAANTAALSIGALDAQAENANGLALVSNVLSTQSADSTHPGVVNNTTQTLSGAKTFSSAPTFSTMTVGSVLFAGTGGLVSQDNSGIFYDATNHRLGLSQTTLTSRLHIKADVDNQAGGIRLEAFTTTSSWELWASNGNVFRIHNFGLNANLFSIDGQSHFTMGGTATNDGTLKILLPNGVEPNADASLVIQKSASQTGAAIDIYDSVPTKNASITHAGAASFTNVTDTALGAGVVRSSAGGLFSSAELSGDVTTSASNATTVAKIQGTTVSGTTGSTNVVFSSAPTMTNPVVGTQASSDNSTKAASTAYVQTALAQLNPAAAVVAASTANIAGTYTNAVSGVCIGDTFQVTSTAAFAPDGVTLTVGQRFLMKDQTSTFQDGVWTLTTAANVGVLGALLTRALDDDSSVDFNAGQIIPVASGTVNAGSSWYRTTYANTTCNSDVQTWTQFQKASSAYASSTLTSAHLFVGNGSNVATDVAASGDLTLANTGAFTIANLAVTNAKIANSTIDLTAKVTGVLPRANNAADRAINAQTGTTYTFVLADGASQGGHPLVTSSNVGAQTITVPTNASVAFPVGEQIDICQVGAGKMTIAAAGGVTLNSKGSNLSASAQYVCLSLVKTATNTWLVIGDLIAWVERWFSFYA